MQDVETRLVAMVERRFGRHPQLQAPLSTLGIDSLEMADFVGVLEREFRIRVDAEIMDVESLAELIQYIETHG